MDVATIYGWCALAICGAAWFSNSSHLQKMSMILFGSWMVSNWVYGTTTPPRLLTLNALSDLSCMALSVLVLIRSPHQRLMRAIIALYTLMLTLHCGWLWFHIQVFVPYFTALNVLFAMQLFIVGGVGVHSLISRLGDSPPVPSRGSAHTAAYRKRT